MASKTLEEFIAEKYYGWTVQENVARETAAEILRVAREKAVEVICSGGLRENRAVRLKDLEDYIQGINEDQDDDNSRAAF